MVALGLTPFTARVAVRYGFVDRRSRRRSDALKPRLGGLAIIVGFLTALGLSFLLDFDRTAAETLKIAGILIGGAVIVVAGVVDDRYELSPRVLLATQIVGAGIVIGFGVVIDGFNNPLAASGQGAFVSLPTVMAVAITLFWIVGAMNTVNFIDGIDGLAAGVAAIAAIVLFAHTFSIGQHSVAALPAALLGASLGFLVFNFPPARVTMGSSGALFLGFAIATMSIVGGTKVATVLLVLGVPIIDTAWLIIWRLMHRRSPFAGDRAHLHHRLLAMGMSERWILLLVYGVTAIFGSMALLLDSPLPKLYLLGLMAAVVFVALIFIARRSVDESG